MVDWNVMAILCCESIFKTERIRKKWKRKARNDDGNLAKYAGTTTIYNVDFLHILYFIALRFQTLEFNQNT